MAAYCPEKVIEGNPCVDYVKHIVFGKFPTFTVGGKVYTAYADFEEAYISGTITPEVLKLDLSKSINEILEPVRIHFATNEKAKAILDEVRSYKTTR